ncbi:hypothetical protein V5T82_14570 [Magnetovibrio sp. PR-2]|uniref:hypothetical protein n=1 Tax=Magnetovibrio sp. PR-2 TaxID=3120356 RepID=UPI002FCDE629
MKLIEHISALFTAGDITSKIRLIIIGIGSALVGVVTTLAIVNAQSHLSLDLLKVNEGEYEFSFEAIGPNPVHVHEVGLNAGQLMWEVKHSVEIPEAQYKDLLSRSYADIEGSTLTKYTTGKLFFPGKPQKEILRIVPGHDRFDTSFLGVKATTISVPYEQSYDGVVVDGVSQLFDFLGLVQRNRTACFYACGQSGQQISCGMADQNIGEVWRDFCTGPFRSDRVCCS